MIDFFVDRFVRFENLDDLVSAIRRKGEQGGGSVRGIRQEEAKGGNAVNLAYALGVFGAEVNLLAVANSLSAEILLATFRNLPNVHIQTIQGDPGYTIALEYRLKSRRVNVMISDPGDLGNFDGTKLSDSNLYQVSHSKIVAIVNWAVNAKGNELCRKVFSLAKKHGALTFFDPADLTGQQIRLKELKQLVFDSGLVDYVSLNENEAREMSKTLFRHNLPHNYTTQDLKKAAAILSDGFGSVVDLHTSKFSVSARGRDVVSEGCLRVAQKTITGAGDIWAAANLAGHLAGLKGSDRLIFANTAAGIYVSREDAIAPTLDEVYRTIRDNYNH